MLPVFTKLNMPFIGCSHFWPDAMMIAPLHEIAPSTIIQKMKNAMRYLTTILIIAILASCDTGLEPKSQVDEVGNLIVNVRVISDWPPAENIFELRFVAFTFVPETPTDFLRIDEMLISEERLELFVDEQTIVFEGIENRLYYYSIIAWQSGPNIFQDWEAPGIYKENNGQFKIEGNTVEISIEVDFDNPEPFPPRNP